MKSLVGVCGHFHQAHERTKLLKKGQEPNWALGLGTGVRSPRLWFTPLDHFIPLLETVFRWKQERGGEMGVIHFLSITSPWRPGGSWCWKTLGLPTTVPWCWWGGAKKLSEPSSSGTPREPSSQSSSYQLLVFGRLPQREFSDAKKAFPPAAFN